ITDVAGVEVGHVTLIEGSGRLQKGKGPVRTGVTAIFPSGKKYTPVFANWHSLNGNGDMTGTHWITESGFLETPILITNTSSVGTVRDAALAWMDKNKYYDTSQHLFWYSYPVVAETWDGLLNDINGFHVKPEHVWQALEKAKSGIVVEGAVGGGTGMVCLGFKGGIGTSSRVTNKETGGYTVGVLVQTNFGRRRQLTIAGVPVGRELLDTLKVVINDPPTAKVIFENELAETGSIIVVVATDAPLLPHQLKRITQRVSLGIGKTGGIGGNGSGDIFIAFSTANKNAFSRTKDTEIKMFSNDMIDGLFAATVQATEEAIINALVAGRTMKGINDNIVPGLPHEAVIKILKKYNRYNPDH
ncbi:MAG TPA: P1 family peptidase, partial [Chitinophagaceae bacterium]|nr:P1 family peptidase [Chitinophagaceae bacterium]